MFNLQILFNDLNMVLLGFLITCAGFMGYLVNPVLNAVLGVLAGAYGVLKYKAKKGEVVESNELYEKYKNYQSPSAKDLASKIMDFNPELDPNLSPRALAIYKQAHRRPNLRREMMEGLLTKKTINLDQIRKPLDLSANVVNLDDYRIAKRTISPKEVS